MNKVCELFPDLNSIRAYLYYIKTIGDIQDVRETYTFVYDLLENEEDKEKIKLNWIQFEKLFGNQKSLNNILKFMNYKDKTKEKILNSNEKINNLENEEKKVIIKNLPAETTEENLIKFIKEKCGTLKIKNLRLIKDENGKNRGFAFVDLNSNDESNFLISEINNQLFLSKIITCAISKNYKNGSNDFRTIFVNNLSFDSTEESIKKILCEFGNILEIRLIKDSNGKNKGFCYVEFQDENSIEKILEKKNIFIDNRKVIIEKSVSNKKIRNNIKFVVFISNLNFKVEEKEIEIFLKEKKNINKNDIKKIKICKENNNKSKGFGFIEFNNFESMNKTLELNNEILKGRNIIIKESERNITEKKFLNKKKLNNQDFKKLFD
jgi:polyadenylate-binding protein